MILHCLILSFACFTPGIHHCPYSHTKSPLKASQVPEAEVAVPGVCVWVIPALQKVLSRPLLGVTSASSLCW